MSLVEKRTLTPRVAWRTTGCARGMRAAWSPFLALARAACGGTTGSTPEAGDSGADARSDGTVAADGALSDSTVSGDSARTDSGADAGADSGVADSGAPRDASADNDPRCPSTYGSTGSCTPNGLTCYYAQGRCDCASQCSGVANPPPTWACVANIGCPNDPPGAGSPCSNGGAHCVYPGCCILDDFTCAQGAWDAAPPFCPP